MCVCTRIYNIDVINAMRFIYAIISIFQHQLDSPASKSMTCKIAVIEGSVGGSTPPRGTFFLIPFFSYKFGVGFSRTSSVFRVSFSRTIPGSVFLVHLRRLGQDFL